MDTAEVMINNRAGAAARVKKASEVADHIEIARVLKPMGLRIKVAGNSFMVLKKIRTAPASKPERTRGSVMVTNICKDLRPRLRAASSSRGLI